METKEQKNNTKIEAYIVNTVSLSLMISAIEIFNKYLNTQISFKILPISIALISIMFALYGYKHNRKMALITNIITLLVSITYTIYTAF